MGSGSGRAAIALAAVGVAAMVGAALEPRRIPVGVLLLAAAIFGAAGLGLGIRALYKGNEDRRRFSPILAAMIAAGPVALGPLMVLLGAVGALVSTMQFSRGRQLRRRGAVLLPPVVAGGQWARAGEALAVEGVDRDALAAQWRENGRTEHASVAAFARLTLDLMSLGAPPELVDAAQRDARDEVRHAELCFALARSIDGRAESPGRFPEAARAATLPRGRVFALASLAVSSLIDGALHEGVSARIVATLARRAEHPRIAALLREIARDEGRHAAHGWDVVRWCVAEGGEPVVRALEGAVLALPTSMASELPSDAQGGGWERFGIMGRELEAAEYARTLADVRRRVSALRPGAARAAA